MPIYPLYAIMFMEHGIDAQGLSYLFVIWSVAAVLMEVPSGILADRFSRKWLVVFSGLFKALAFLTWYQGQNFEAYAIGFVLWGVGGSFRSGAFEALLENTLRREGLESRFAWHYGKMGALATCCVTMGELLGGVMIVLGFDWVLLLSSMIAVLSVLPIIFYVRDPAVETAADTSSTSILSLAVKDIVTNPKLQVIFWLSLILLPVAEIYDEFVPPTLLELEANLSLVVLYGALSTVLYAMGQLAASYGNSSVTRLLLLMLLSGFLLVITSCFEIEIVALLIALFFGVYGYAGVLLMSQLQAEVEAAARATVASLIGLAETLGGILWLVVFGYFAAQESMLQATTYLGWFVVLIAGVFMLISRLHRTTD